jgi:hypothetical protein
MIYAGAIIMITVIIAASFIKMCKDTYKIGYYEQKLKNRGVDITHVENMSFMDIWK